MFWSIRSVVYISNFGFLVGVFLRGRGPWWNFPKLDGYGVREILQVGAREKLLSPGPTRFLENLNRGSNSRSKKSKWYRQSWTKVWNFFLSASESPHPRFNDEAKTQGEHIIEPGVRGFIIELGVRGMGENRQMVALKTFQTFVQHGRK